MGPHQWESVAFVELSPYAKGPHIVSSTEVSPEVAPDPRAPAHPKPHRGRFWHPSDSTRPDTNCPVVGGSPAGGKGYGGWEGFPLLMPLADYFDGWFGLSWDAFARGLSQLGAMMGCNGQSFGVWFV